jgi:ABC-type glycerol-3-phosphate transport system substrate-binding protein
LGRRRFLALAGGLGTAALLAACGGGVDVSTPTVARPSAAPGAASGATSSAPSAAPGGAPATTASGTAPGSATTGTATRAATGGTATVASASKPSGNYGFPSTLKSGTTLRYQTFWAQYRTDILKQSIDQFTQRTGVKVTVESIPGADYRTSLATTMAAGTAPDVFIADIWNMVKYYDSGLVLDLSDRVKADNIDLNKDYGLVGLEQYCGKTYMLPFVLSPHAWYYNKNMLKEVGAKDPWDDLNGQWTFDDFREMALKVTQAGGGKRWGAQLGATVEYNWDPIIRTAGGAPTDFKASPPKYAIGSDASIAALTMIRDWYTKDKIILPPDQSKSLVDQGVTSPFASKLVALYEDSTGQLTFLGQNVKDFEWDIAPPLRKSKDSAPIGHSDGDPTAVSAKTKNPDEAYAFAKHLAGPTTQDLLAQNKLLLPSLKASAGSPAYLSAPPKHMAVFPGVLSGSYATSFYHGDGLEASQAMTAFAEQLVLGSKQPSDAKALQDDLNQNVKFGGCIPSYVSK